MCFSADSALTAPTSVASYRRWYQDTMITITGPHHRKLIVTPSQPLLTHRGWVQASFVQPGDFLVNVVVDRGMSTVAEAWEQDPRPVSTVPDAPFAFWGDAAVGGDAEVKGQAHGGLFATSGQQPSTPSPATVWGLLGALTTPEALGAASWAQAVAKVPGLGRTWPRGEPTQRGAELPATAKARLGRAVLELPEPREERYPQWTQELLGVPVERPWLAKVALVRRSVLRGWVFNEACTSGAFVANGCVVGSSS